MFIKNNFLIETKTKIIAKSLSESFLTLVNTKVNPLIFFSELKGFYVVVYEFVIKNLMIFFSKLRNNSI